MITSFQNPKACVWGWGVGGRAVSDERTDLEGSGQVRSDQV